MDIRHFLTAGVIALAAGNALADSNGNWYAGADVGITQSSTSAANFYRNPDWCSTGYNCTTDTSDTVWQLRAGYRLTDRIAIEGSYADLGKTFNATITNPGNPNFAGKGEQKTKVLALSAIGKLPLGTNHRWQAYGKAGVAHWESKASYRNDSAYTGNTDATKRGVSPVIGAGVEYALSNRWVARAGVERYFGVGERNPLLDWATPQTARTVNANINAATLGVAYRF